MRTQSNLHAGTLRFISVEQGDFIVLSQSDVILTTVLGSCVSACLFDPAAGVGGMNHIVLPGINAAIGEEGLSVNAMEQLINGLMKAGAAKSRLRAKVFGGAQVIKGLSRAGSANTGFVREFLENENIPCLSESIGGFHGRSVQFWPSTGRAQQKLMPEIRDDVVKPDTAEIVAAGEVKLF